MKLNVRLLSPSLPAQHASRPPIVLLHGLFGSLDNLGVLARDLARDHDVLQVDMRNHGLSGHSDIMNYDVMAQDILDTLDASAFTKVTLIGHSMGGKAAMAFSALAGVRLANLIVIDIAPVDYQVRRHDSIFNAIEAVRAAGVSSRSDAAAIMKRYISEPAVILFLLKSFSAGEWRFNVPVLRSQYSQIIGWRPLPPWPHPALFIRGTDSSYLKADYQPAVFAQFPNTQLCSVADCGHWLHAQNPAAVTGHIRNFLQVK